MKRSLAFITIVLALTAAAGCSGGTTPTGGGGGTSSMSFAQIGATGGWFPSVAFDPAHEGTVWASGDDGTGLYRSTDGGKDWTIVQTGAPNQATYSLRFDPNNPGTIYAPNHFGRGMLMSTNDGATWTASQAGLPISGQPSQALNDLAVDPTNSSSVYIATDNGLYHSTNGGSSFTLTSTTLGGSAGVGAVAFRPDGVLFIGTEQGAFGYYNAGSWTQLLAPSSVAIKAIVFSNTSLYLVYADALIYRLDKTSFSSTTINNPGLSGSIQNLNRITLAVVSGSSATTDTVYVSTMGQATIPVSQWGLFKSGNGGGSWSQLLTGNLMSVAVDPLNASNVVAGSGGGLGIYYSTNAGANFTLASTTNLYSTAGVALAQDSANPLHALASETACGGWGLDYETTNGGASWTSFVDPIADDGILSFNFDPVNTGTILAGTCTQGILRTTTGTSGSWTAVATTASQRVLRLARDKINPANVYAIVPTGDGNHNLYVSTNSGASFSPIAGIAADSVGVHPSNAGEAIVVTTSDALVTTNAFSSTISLGLATFVSQQGISEGGFSAVAYNPSNPREVLVGGASGGLYHTTTYSSSGTGVSWTKLSAPMIASGIQDVVIVNRGGRAVYYATATAPDTGVTATSTQGVFRSLDGVTWTAISSPLFPSSMPWRMIPDAAAPTSQFLIGMWSGGIYRLTDTQ